MIRRMAEIEEFYNEHFGAAIYINVKKNEGLPLNYCIIFDCAVYKINNHNYIIID